MKEIKEIIKSYDELVKQGKKCVLATVVHVEGSSYRQPGARMLIHEDGHLTGAISGGCLEGDALKKALDVIAANTAEVITYDTLNEEDPTIGVALGCNGIIKILLEPINVENNNNAIELLRKASSERINQVLVTMFSEDKSRSKHMGTKLLFNNESDYLGDIDIEHLNAVLYGIPEIFENQKSKWLTLRQLNDDKIFFEYYSPEIKLVVIGAGNDVMPMLDMAHILGWETKVIDCRVKYAMDKRVPPSCATLIDSPDDLLTEVEIDEFTVFALMTHNYNYDKAVLHPLAMIKDIKYIGLLGPKKKLNKMLDDYESEGRGLNEHQLTKIYGPAGLNIGAETPEEIAISIISEIKMVMSGLIGNSLKHIQGKIHAN